MLRAGDVHDAIVISGSSVLGQWVSDLVREACVRATPPVDVEIADRDQAPADLGRVEGARRTLIVTHPGRRIADAVAGTTIPVVAVLDDPVDSVRFTKAAAGTDVLNALRLSTSCAAANHVLPNNSAVTLVHRAFQGSALEIVALVVEHLRLDLEPINLQALIEAFAGPIDAPWRLETALERRVPHYVRLDHLADTITADEAMLARQVLSPMVLGAISHDIGIITWPSKVFLSGDKPNEVAPAVADVTGAARIIYYGPYFHLPPGTWQVRLLLAFSMEARGTPFRLTFYCDNKAIAKVLLRPSDGGAFEGTFTMQHHDPEHNIEVHFMNDEGTIEGHMALGQVTFSRIAG